LLKAVSHAVNTAAFSSRSAAGASVRCCAADICGKRGIMIKPFFDDAAQDDHSTKLYGHVTHTQFKQCLSVKVRSSGSCV
jgi:hypothetical protein